MTHARLAAALGAPWLPQALRILAACAIAYGLAALTGLPERFWAMITAVVVTQPVLGATLAAGRDRIVGTVIGAVAGLLVIEVARLGVSSLLLFWVALVPLAILTALRPNLRLSCITLIVVVLVPSEGPAAARAIDRVLQILLGTLASIGVSLVRLPGARP
jgi:uncharacterized membrane protein YccC